MRTAGIIYQIKTMKTQAPTTHTKIRMQGTFWTNSTHYSLTWLRDGCQNCLVAPFPSPTIIATSNKFAIALLKTTNTILSIEESDALTQSNFIENTPTTGDIARDTIWRLTWSKMQSKTWESHCQTWTNSICKNKFATDRIYWLLTLTSKVATWI